MKYIIQAICLLVAMVTQASVPPDSIKVSIVNFYPGSDIYELEGHTALRIRWSEIDPGIAISYGTFDFNQPNFVYRFVKGETDYWVTQVPWEPFEDMYKSQNRRIVEHDIMLDSAQKVSLVSLVADNLLPANRVYRYNYVKDNCATRPLNIVERALGAQIALPQPYGTINGETVDVLPDASFRDIMAYYHRNYPWYQFGIDLALGSGIDYPTTAREKAFAPVLLDRQLTMASALGNPLVGAPRVLYAGGDATAGPTPWLLTPMAVCWMVFALMLAVTIYDIRRHRRGLPRATASKAADTAFYTILGILGLVLTFLIFISTHEATSPNWLYLWLNPLCLVVPIFVWLKKCKNIVVSYQYINFALILIMLLTWPLHLQHMNAALIPLIAADMMRAATYICYRFE